MQQLLLDISNYMTDNLGADLFDRTASFIEGIAPFISLGFSIYLLLLVFYYYNRGLDDSIVDLGKKLVGWLIIIAFALNAGVYQSIALALYDLPEQLVTWFNGTVINTTQLASGFDAINGMIASLDALTNDYPWYQIQLQLTVLGAKVFVAIFGVALLVFAYFFYLIAKLLLGLTLMVGPLFIAALLFPATRQYGMNWIGQVLNFSIACLLYSIVSLLQLGFVQVRLEEWGGEDYIENIAVAWEITLSLVVMTILYMIVLFSVSNIASALTGGASVDGHGRTMGRLGSMATRAISKVPILNSVNKIIGK